MRCASKIMTFLVGIVVGIALAVGGTVGAFFVFKVKDVNQKLGLGLNLPEEVANMSIAQYGANIATLVANIKTTTLGQLEEATGFDKLSAELANRFGIDRDELSESVVAELPKFIVNHLTVGGVKDGLGIPLPSLPLFEDETFLSQPILSAFNNLTGYPLNMFLTPTPGSLLEKISDKPLSQIETAVYDLTLGEVGLSGNFSEEFKAIKLNQINDPDSGIMSLKLTDFGVQFASPTPLITRIADIPVGKFGDPTVGLTAAINDATLAEVIANYPPDDPAHPSFLQALRNSKLGSLTADIQNLRVDDIFPINGILTILPVDQDGKYPLLQNLNVALTDALPTATLGQLFDAGVLGGNQGIYDKLSPNSPTVSQTARDTTLIAAIAAAVVLA